MKPALKIWMNGKIVPAAKANLFNFHQGLNYGACVYEGIRSYRTASGPAVFRLKEHLDRFCYSAAALRMNLGCSKREVEAAIFELLKANKITSGYIRPVAFYSEPKMGINILGSKVTFLILVWPWDDSKPIAPSRLSISKYRKIAPTAIDIKAKIAGYYAGGLLGFIEAREAGYDQPLFLDERGCIAEGAISNIFIVKGKTLYTPTTRNILSGITRDSVITLAKDSGLEVIEKDLKPEFLKTADEVFLTGTGIQIQIVAEIKNYFKQKGTSAITEGIDRYYKQIVMGELSRYRKWLSVR